jgi:hypothetical protein
MRPFKGATIAMVIEKTLPNVHPGIQGFGMELSAISRHLKSPLSPLYKGEDPYRFPPFEKGE